MPFRRLSLAEITIRGERAMKPVGVYAALKRLLVADGFTFRAPEPGSRHAHQDRVLFLNLTYWSAGDGSDVLVDDTLEADVLAHAAWHHAARKALGAAAPTAATMFLGESVASAFDLYLVGHMLRQKKQTAFLASQVPAMSAAALDAGVTEEELEALFASVAESPDRAFEDLRELLFDAALALVGCPDVDAAVATLDRFGGHRFFGILHHYELATWVLYARAYAAPPVPDDPAVALDRAIRAAPVAIDWLEANWLPPTARSPRS